MIDLKKKRTTDTIDVHLGSILIFCEGYTEYNYFEFLNSKSNFNTNKYNSLHVELVNSGGGGARGVFNSAVDFLSKEENSKYHFYEKVLLFDLDDPEDIDLMKCVFDDIRNSSYDFISYVSHLNFDIWLIMHLIDVNIGDYTSKRRIRRFLEERLQLEHSYNNYKNDPGLIAKILVDINSIKSAINCAKKLEKAYKNLELELEKDYKQMNPYSNVYIIVLDIINHLQVW